MLKIRCVDTKVCNKEAAWLNVFKTHSLHIGGYIYSTCALEYESSLKHKRTY